jgi:hypothetical protein
MATENDDDTYVDPDHEREGEAEGEGKNGDALAEALRDSDQDEDEDDLELYEERLVESLVEMLEEAEIDEETKEAIIPIRDLIGRDFVGRFETYDQMVEFLQEFGYAEERDRF